MNQLQNPFLEESAHLRTQKLRRNIAAYIRRWPVFLLSILLFLFLAWLYTRYLTPIYQTEIKVLIKDTRQNPGTNMLLSDVAITGSITGSIDNDIELMKSERLIQQVVEKLHLQYVYTREGRVIEIESFRNHIPIHLNYTPENQIEFPSISFEVEYNHPHITIYTSSGEEIKTEVNKKFKYQNNIYHFTSNPLRNIENDRFKVHTAPTRATVKRLQNSLNAELVGNYTTVLRIFYNNPLPVKAEAVLNQLITEYNQDAIRDKNLEFDKTAEFIEDRINIINDELSGVEGEKESFKTRNDLAILEAEAAQSIGNKSGLENQLLAAETQLSLVNSYKSYVQGQGIHEILPADISESSGATNQVINSYNTLVTERNNLIATGATEKHPLVRNLTTNINTTKDAIISNIDKNITALNRTRNNYAAQLGQTTSFKSSVPRLERISRDIDRQQQVKENLYLLLLQKREEAAISKAITSEKAKIIDPPYSVGPVGPIKSRYYFGALALGLLLPLAFIYTRELLKNKIETRGDLEELVKGNPIVAELPKVTMEEEFQLVGSDLSIMSEAFRIMRTNIEFVISQRLNHVKGGKVILVTSSIKGEGKTFVSMNYAHVLGQLKGKKAVIIGADIRNPQLHRYDRSNKKALGLTEYLYDDQYSIQDIIQVSNSDNKTHIIFSGRIPPNPTELLMSDKFDNLIANLRETYDYVIIDSAPLVLVSDTYHISNNADLTVYVTRSEFTPKDVIKVPMDALEEGRLTNVIFALNDISTAHSGYAYGYKYNYGYGYGYGTMNRRRTPWKRFLSSFGINTK
ncbi:MAG: polysaccharide biosynthesis tyrosine autokinase [Flavobacteriaceae bacterium]|nr:polysaccharide biosynthesis tyrosine autokinase [Flavobacteriaceae bacterium]